MQTEAEVQSFMCDVGWCDYKREKIDADFSTRLYERLSRDNAIPKTAILMRAAADQKTEAFVQMSALLRRLGISAPQIYASDVIRGITLMEDFGDRTVGSALDDGEDRGPSDAAAAALLATLHTKFSQTMLGAFKAPLYNAALFTDQATLFLDFYFPTLFRRPATARERSAFVESWHTVLAPLDALPRSLVLRDFMPDNMMVLDTPVLGHKFGLLDFQDAGIGSVAYDLASWCEEVRRDGGVERIESFVDAYHALNGEADKQTLLSAVRVYAAQRHVRILGLLVKLDRPAYLPRTWKAFQALVKTPELAPVRRWFMACAPASGVP